MASIAAFAFTSPSRLASPRADRSVAWTRRTDAAEILRERPQLDSASSSGRQQPRDTPSGGSVTAASSSGHGGGGEALHRHPHLGVGDDEGVAVGGFRAVRRFLAHCVVDAVKAGGPTPKRRCERPSRPSLASSGPDIPKRNRVVPPTADPTCIGRPISRSVGLGGLRGRWCWGSPHPSRGARRGALNDKAATAAS